MGPNRERCALGLLQVEERSKDCRQDAKQQVASDGAWAPQHSSHRLAAPSDAFCLQIIFHVGVHCRRPQLPPSVPAPLASLIRRCWDDDPTARPSFREILELLQVCAVTQVWDMCITRTHTVQA